MEECPPVRDNFFSDLKDPREIEAGSGSHQAANLVPAGAIHGAGSARGQTSFGHNALWEHNIYYAVTLLSRVMAFKEHSHFFVPIKCCSNGFEASVGRRK